MITRQISQIKRHLAIAVVFALVGASAHRAECEELKYVKRDSRAATLTASVESTLGQAIPTGWQLLGPCKSSDQAMIEASLLGADGPSLDAEFPGKKDPVRWKKVEYPDGRVQSLQSLRETKDVACYLYRQIDAETAKPVRVSLGFDDTMTVWLNGQQLFTGDLSRTLRTASADQALLTLPLRAGKNHLLLRIVNKDGPWSFYFAPTLPQAVLTKLERRLDRDFPPSGEAGYYRVESLPTPSGESLEVGAMSFRPDGKLYVATRRGDIWLVDNVTSDDPDQISYRLYARGLHEVLGICVLDDRTLLIAQRPEVTKIEDTDGDDQADTFITVSDRFAMSGAYHEFHYGPARDRAGNLFIALNLGLVGDQLEVAYRGCVMRIGTDGVTEPWAYGFRSPNGIRFSPDQRLFISDNQGEWIPTCKLMEVRQGDFHGHKKSLPWMKRESADVEPPMTPPAIWFPYGMCRSASEPTWDTTEGKFGPFAGQCFVGENTNSLIMRVEMEEVAGRMQGACFGFRKGLSSGVNRLCFAPDGSLLVGQTNRGWGSVGGQTYSIQRLLFTGRTPFEILSMHATPTGWTIRFTAPVKEELATKLENYFLESYTYHYWERYGSPEIEKTGHPVTSVKIEDEGRVIRVETDERKTGRVYRLKIDGLTSAEGDPLLHREAFYTLNAIP